MSKKITLDHYAHTHALAHASLWYEKVINGLSVSHLHAPQCEVLDYVKGLNDMSKKIQPGCRESKCKERSLHNSPYCKAHHKDFQQRRLYVADTHKEQNPFYKSRRWEELREACLNDEPLCRTCKTEGKIILADVVDHIIPISQGGSASDPFNLQSLCYDCHTKKTNEESGIFQRKQDKYLSKVIFVCGPPYSGKTRHIAFNAARGDLLISIERILMSLSFISSNQELIPIAQRLYNALVQSLLITRVNSTVWIEGEDPDGSEAEKHSMFGAEIVRLELDYEEAQRRAMRNHGHGNGLDRVENYYFILNEAQREAL